jgi:transposase
MGPARAQATRPARGYPSDLSDARWRLIAPCLPERVPGGRGRPPVHSLRQVVNAILYVGRTGCPWRYLPVGYPPWPTVYGYFARWRDDGTLARLHGWLRGAAPAAGRTAQPTAAITGLPVGARRRHRTQGHPGLGCRQEGQRPQAAHS